MVIWRQGAGFWLAVLLAAGLPSQARSDRGEAYVKAGGGGSLSFYRNPHLAHRSRLPRLNAMTITTEGTVGIGVSDSVSVGFGGRFFLPCQVIEREVYAQGFALGDASYETLQVQIPISVTGLWIRGFPLGIGLTLEAGIEWGRWDLRAIIDSENPSSHYAVELSSDWSMAFFSSLHPFVEWRHFDHFSFNAGPRAIVSSTGSLHLGVAVGATLLWGVGLF